MQYLKWTAGAAAGAALGGIVWVVASGLANTHLGFLICLVGVLAGLGVRRTARDDDARIIPAVLAVLCTLIIGLIAKYNAALNSTPPRHQEFWTQVADNSVGDESMIGTLADEVVLERESRQEAVNWPDPTMTFADAAFEEDYPADIWAEGRSRWEALTPEQQAEHREEHARKVADVIDRQRGPERSAVFRSALTSWDIIWFTAAMIGAFWLAGRFDA